MKFAIGMLIAAMLLMTLVGCTDSNNGTGGTTGSTLILGTWQPVSATQNGNIVALPGVLGFPAANVVTQTVTFGANNVVTINSFDAEGALVSTQTGTFTANNNGTGTLTLNGVTTNFTFTTTGSTNSILKITTVNTTTNTTTVVTYVKTTAVIDQHDPALVSNFNITTITVNGVTQTPADFFGVVGTTSATLNLLADGTANFVVSNGTTNTTVATGTWTTGGGLLKIVITNATKTFTFIGPYTISGNTVTWTYLNPGGQTVQLTLTKI